MTMADAGMAGIWAAAGLIGGAAYVAGLGANVRAYLGAGPVPWAVALHVLRLALAGAVFTAAATSAGIAGLLGLLSGFLFARSTMLHRLKARP